MKEIEAYGTVIENKDIDYSHIDVRIPEDYEEKYPDVIDSYVNAKSRIYYYATRIQHVYYLPSVLYQRGYKNKFVNIFYEDFNELGFVPEGYEYLKEFY